MTKVISFISRKGGTGKTTNAINLATYLSDGKKKVLLLETDANYTLNSLRKLELFKLKQKKDTYFKIVGSQDNRVASEIVSLKARNTYDYIIVDSAGKTTDQGIRELCLESNMVLITTSITQNDLLVAYQTVKDLIPATTLNKELKLCLLANRIPRFTRMSSVKAQLALINIDVVEAYVPQRKNYTSPSTIKPDRHYKNVGQQIMKQLG